MEAWEVLAGELPPGLIWDSNDPEWYVCIFADGGELIEGGDIRDEVADAAWSWWTARSSVSRRQHAEDTALRKVREAAGLLAKVTAIFWPDEVRILVKGHPKEGWWDGPDICTAALRCINALVAAP